MKKYFRLILMCFCCMLLFSAAKAQTPQKDTIRVGNAIGLVRDSVHNYVLRSATVAVYKLHGNELMGYQLTNTFGRYQFKDLPVDMPLYLVITHLDYLSGRKEFTISAKTKTIDLKTINVQRRDRSLKEVTINAQQAPMQMHGDTLEFNASAFKLDSNAVVGDMLRKLPGVTVWADGVITVNGQKINSLLVEGKPFMGGDNKIALDNLPKNSVQKIQVYQNKDDPDPVHPKVDMNIVLKKGKKDGMYGKFGLGYGSNAHYAGDGMITYYSPKTQLSVVGAFNDVNKTAYNVNTLMRFNSFKGDGINDDYHSDFTRQGANVFRGAGAIFSQDFSKDADARAAYAKTNMLNGEVFTSDLDNKTVKNGLKVTSLGQAGNLVQTSNDTHHGNDLSVRSVWGYEKRFEHSALSAHYTINNTQSTSENNETTDVLNDKTLDKSERVEQQTLTKNATTNNGTIQLTTNRFYDYGTQKNKSVSADFTYSFELDRSNSDNKTITNFTTANAAQGQYYNRQYLTDANGGTHDFKTNLKDITRLLKRRGNQFMQVDIDNELNLRYLNENDNVGDLASGATVYTPNKGLTNVTHYTTVDEQPGIYMSKSWSKSLDNRFSKSWRVYVNALAEIYSQKNESLQAVQNINRSYSYFTPAVDFTSYNQQYGDFFRNYSLGYLSDVIYPTINQMAPLVDNSQIYYVPQANLGLKPAYKHSVYLKYSYSDQKKKNPLYYNIQLSADLTKNNITDSSSYDTLGRSLHRFINGGDARAANYNGAINKAFNFKDHQIQLYGSSGFAYSNYSTNVNGTNYQSQTSSLKGSGYLSYTYKSIWEASVGETFDGSKTHPGTLSRFTTYTWATNGGFGFAFPRSVFFNTRVDFKNTKTSAIDHNIYYTIWNADLGYRFLKGSNGEVKFSLLDILHQNKSIQNSIGPNSVTTTTASVLQQYFMVTLAYYPRHFGLRK